MDVSIGIQKRLQTIESRTVEKEKYQSLRLRRMTGIAHLGSANNTYILANHSNKLDDSNLPFRSVHSTRQFQQKV